jgi:predicted component of type VI protein secretion system
MKIRSLLRGAVAPSFLRVEFAREEGILVATLEEGHLTRPNEYFLGVKTKADPTTVARLVEDADKFKLMPKGWVSRAVRGVELKRAEYPPLTLPSEIGLLYFRLHLARDEKDPMWRQLREKKEMAIKWSRAEMESSDFQVSLYMTVPEEEK